MKLIDADEIIKRFNERSEDDWNKRTMTTWAGAYEDIADEIDDEEECIIRCKGCKHGIGDENAFVCGLKQLTAGMDWFCADGVKRDE